VGQGEGGAPSALPCRAPLLALAAVLALALSLLGGASAPAAAPPTPPEKVPELKEGDPIEFEFERKGRGLALAILGAGAAPQAGALGQMVLLHAAERPPFEAWHVANETAMNTRHGRRWVGQGTLVLNGAGVNAGAAGPGLGQALHQLATLRAGDRLDCWALVDTDRFRRLPKGLLREVKDGQGIYVGTLEASAYAKVLLRAHLTSRQAFASAARHDLTYAHLFNHADKYRGEVAHIEGRLLRVSRTDPPPEAAEEGVHDRYEAWVFNRSYGPNPYCVVFTQWPAGLSRDLLGQPAIEADITVSFDGYFFKKFGYKGGDSKGGARREAPMLIGSSLTLKGGPPGPGPNADSTQWVTSLLYVLLGLFAGCVCVVGGLSWWYRRTDRDVRRRLLAARAGELVLPPPDALPVAAPVGALRPSGAFNGADRARTPPAGAVAPSRAGDRGAAGDASVGPAGAVGKKGASPPGEAGPVEDAGA
jgi:hypothetical protein